MLDEGMSLFRHGAGERVVRVHAVREGLELRAVDETREAGESEPFAPKSRDRLARARIGEHPLYGSLVALIAVQLARGRCSEQLLVRHGAPEEVAEPRRLFV